MEWGRFILAVALTNSGVFLLFATIWRTVFPREEVWYPIAAAVQYAAGLACIALGAGLLGWLW